jgi:hypothetical protein
MYCSVTSKRGRDWAHSIHAGVQKACPFFLLNFKGTPLPEEHKTIVSSLNISDMALSAQIAFFCLWKMTYGNFINSRIQ